jgi:hypothetical protein
MSGLPRIGRRRSVSINPTNESNDGNRRSPRNNWSRGRYSPIHPPAYVPGDDTQKYGLGYFQSPYEHTNAKIERRLEGGPNMPSGSYPITARGRYAQAATANPERYYTDPKGNIFQQICTAEGLCKLVLVVAAAAAGMRFFMGGKKTRRSRKPRKHRKTRSRR